MARFDGDAGEGEDDAREYVDDDLLVHARDLAGPFGASAKDEVTADKAAKEGVVGS